VLIGAALAGFACFALLAIGTELFTGTWDAGRWHNGVGPWSTWVVLIAPFIFALIAPPPAGFGGGKRMVVLGLALLALVIVTARMTDNRVVWLALATVFGTASIAAGVRWPQTLTRTPLRWIAPVAVMLVVLALAFADVLEERAETGATAGSVTASIERDPRMYDLYKSYISTWQSQFGDLMTLFAMTGPISNYGGWGMTEYNGQPIDQAPKLRAVRDFLGITVASNDTRRTTSGELAHRSMISIRRFDSGGLFRK